MFNLLNKCCYYFCPYFLNDEGSDSDISEATTLDNNIQYYKFKDKSTFTHTNPLLDNKMIRD